MAFTPSEFHWYYQLKPCQLRVYLKEQGVQPAEPDAYHKLLERLGERHERQHLETLGTYFDADGSVKATREAVARKERVIYHPGLRVVHKEYGEVEGIPDFFIWSGSGYLIRDCKLARRFSEEHHAEIFRQLELYGWLYEQTFGVLPTRLEAHMGDGSLQTIVYEPQRALEMLAFIQQVKKMPEEPFDPVGWSKCMDCAFNEFVWKRARERHDVALLPSVDQALARALHGQGIMTYDELIKCHTETTLVKVKKTVGGKERTVSENAAKRILKEAEAHISGKVIVLKAPAVKIVPNVVAFDLEGIPPHLDYSERIYLWGLKVFGKRSRPPMIAIGNVGVDGDQLGWQRFLQSCQELFSEYGDVPFIHWSHYERTQVRKYVEKYGDPDGIAARVLENLYDLYPVVEGSLVLPIPSYSLKVVEQVVGFTRKIPEANGKWSMATYIEAIETEDPKKAGELIGQIVQYNEEDLDALWAVYQWLVKLQGE